MPAVRVTNLNTSLGQFAKVFKVDMDDGATVLGTGLVSVTLPGFEADTAHGNSRVGFVPNADLIKMTCLNDVADAGAVYGTFDRASFIKDPADASNTTMLLDLYLSAKVYAVILEIPV